MSLRKDEMTPTERSIQNRIKEAFQFNIEPDYWVKIMKYIEENMSHYE